MQTLNKNELNLLEGIFTLTEKELLNLMTKYLKKHYTQVRASDDWIIATGDIPIGLVAHLDTVFTTQPKDIFYDKQKNVIWSPQGLGADDRAGVYAILQVLKKGYKPTIIFTTGEESGAIGATNLTYCTFNQAPELKYLIELDRRGANDCVFYECDNDDFSKYIESFGFVTQWGTFSDISVLAPAWKTAAVNLSIGYEHEHSCQEVLYIGHMLNTINKVCKMLDDSNNAETYEYIELDSSYYTYSWYKQDEDLDDYGWDPAWGISRKDWIEWCRPKTMETCMGCLKDYELHELCEITTGKDTKMYLCPDCYGHYEDTIEFCDYCHNSYFIDKNNSKKLCPKCEVTLSV